MSGCNSVELTYYPRNRDVILNRIEDYYENDKERLRNKQEINTGNYLKKKKNKKREYGKNRNQNMSEEEKQKPKEYQKIIARLKSLNIIMNKIVFYL